ncbi:putative transposon, En/Spm-like, transposase-associated domain protein [Tanacetum coccineum]
MVWHHTHKTKQGSMAHPSDGKVWKHFDSINSDFAEEIRNVRLGLCTNGFSPNNSNSNPYSLWPIFLTINNLPPWMSLKDSYVFLSLVIPGRKRPGQNLDVFLRPLIDELKDLYDDGIETYDAYHTKSFRLTSGGKPCWFDCHRRFLPPKHAFRHDKKGFKANSTVASSIGPPLVLTGHELYQQVYDIPTVYEGVPYDPKAPKPPGFGKHIIG